MPSCHSTNDISAELISKGVIENGTIVITDHQTKGRGQSGNTWESEKGENLTFSIILDTSFLKLQDQFYLNMIVCLALSDLILEYVGAGVTIKWPNDIYYKDQKICGVLIQNSLKGNQLEYSILGMGININQQKFINRNAISLKNITGRWYNLENVLQGIVEKMELYYNVLKAGNLEKLKNIYMKRLMWLNEEHTFHARNPFTGKITDIDERGRLLILSDDIIRAFDFKEIRFVK